MLVTIETKIRFILRLNKKTKVCEGVRLKVLSTSKEEEDIIRIIGKRIWGKPMTNDEFFSIYE